jgi:hypothetical protein
MKLPETVIAAAEKYGGVETEAGGVKFLTADAALKTLAEFGITIRLADNLLSRETMLRVAQDGRPILDIDRLPKESQPNGWRAKTKTLWTRIFKGTLVKGDDDLDEVIRAVDTPDNKFGAWYMGCENGWVKHPGHNIYLYLRHLGHERTAAEAAMGRAIMQAWRQVSIPFAGEYPGNRQWNLSAPQYAHVPAEGPHPNWDKCFAHWGKYLTPDLAPIKGPDGELLPNPRNPWAFRLGILDGPSYLKMWYACCLRYPDVPLPILFFFGPEDSGKSLFFEAFGFLVTRGVANVYKAVKSRDEFNKELWGTVLAYIDEKDLSEIPGAIQRLKEWSTCRKLSIRKMCTDPFEVDSFLHFVHCANSRHFLNVWPGDTRITVCHVGDLMEEEKIAKPKLEQLLLEEAPRILYTLLTMELPPLTDRLRLPVVTTDAKRELQEENAPEHARKLAEWFKEDWTGNTEKLKEAVPEIKWPEHGRKVRQIVESSQPYLKQHGIMVDFRPGTRDGLQITFRRP